MKEPFLKVKRTFFADTYTIGKMYVEGEYFCDTLEDKNRDLNKNGVFDGDEKKVYGETCIPFGQYKVKMHFSPKFSPRYNGRKVPWIQNVPHFEGILIHSGNTDKDTLGCILVGENTQKGKVLNSKATLLKLLDRIGDKDDFEILIE